MRRSRRQATEHTPRRKGIWKYISIVGLVLALLVSAVLFAPIHLRLHLAVMDQSTGNVHVYSFEDRVSDVLVIPGDAVMTTAGNLGEWPAKSLWKLGHDEKQGGNLLTRSIVKTFGFPVGRSAEPEFISAINNGGFVGFVKIVSMNDTNISLLERLNLAIASFRGTDLQVRNLKGTSALDEIDDHGETRFKVHDRIPISFTTQFDEDEISAKVPTVGILDGTESSLSAQWLVKLVNVIGGRVVSRDRTEWSETCEISGKGKLAQYLADILPCKLIQESAEPFDVKIKLGEKFTQVM